MQNKKGFTLIELLVVVLIIAILSAVALPQYIKTVERTRSTEALLNLKAFTDAANRYWMANDQSYVGIGSDGSRIIPTSLPNLDITLPSNGWFDYYVGGMRPGTGSALRTTTDSTLVLGARRKMITAKTYVYNYYLANGELVGRTCASQDTTLCKGLVTIGPGTDGTIPATCGEVYATFDTSGTTPRFDSNGACALRN